MFNLISFINELNFLIIMADSRIINYDSLWERTCEWARKMGRVTARPVLLLFFVMTSKDTQWNDKAAIFTAISYLVLPIDLISAKRVPIIGWIDEATSLAVAIQKMQKYVTPEIQRKVDDVLDKWFPEYTNFEEIIE